MTETTSPNDFTRFWGAPSDKLFTCRRCQAEFYPPLWFFDGLCNSCFALFDKTKMEGRFGYGPRCENSDVWIKEHPIEGKA